MTDATPDRPAESILGPITPIRCTEPGCHWACHGVPDKYADSRARIVREHLAAEHAPTPESPDRPADQLRAAAVCASTPPELATLLTRLADASDHHALGEGGVVATLVHPALAVARQLLGTSAAEGARCICGETACESENCDCDSRTCPVDHAAEETDEEREQREDREATARDHAAGDHQHCDITCEVEMPTEHLRNFVIAKGYPGTAGALDELLRRAAAPPAPADRAATLTEAERTMLTYALDQAQEHIWSRDGFTDEDQAAVTSLRALADGAAAGVQPPTSDAHPAEYHWAAELHDPTANEWVPFGSSNVRDTAVHRLAHARKVAPLWKDGTPTERRLVRATTTYTVEPEPAAPAAPEETQ
ncbi:hypothetical protein [Streptomyces sp. YPW6]|uniref:hypothetical protein n=1 Tax=Streptomyces sp. YPW6 TaxID=2840373 RepID=UPI003D73A403